MEGGNFVFWPSPPWQSN